MRLAAGKLTLDLAPELGGSVAAFEHDGMALMRPMSPPTGARPHALYSGMFPMLPFANSLRDNRFGIDGRTYEVAPNMPGARLNYHGCGWQRPWRAVEAGAESCIQRLDDAEEASGYSFSATQRFALSPDRLTVSIAVTNRSPQRMPFGVGLHPWFPRHGDARTRFAARETLLEDADFQALHPAPIPLEQDYASGREPPRAYQNRCYIGWDGHAEIDWPSRGVGLHIDADPLFGNLMFHVPAHDHDTFCLEPQSNRTSAFDGVETGTPAAGVHILEQGETMGGSVAFVVRR